MNGRAHLIVPVLGWDPRGRGDPYRSQCSTCSAQVATQLGPRPQPEDDEAPPVPNSDLACGGISPPCPQSRRLESSAIASPEQHQPLFRDVAAMANSLLFRRWNQSPIALLLL